MISAVEEEEDVGLSKNYLLNVQKLEGVRPCAARDSEYSTWVSMCNEESMQVEQFDYVTF